MAGKTGSSYEAIDSPIDKLDPITKFVAVFSLGLSALIFPHFIMGYILLLGLFGVAYKAKILKKFSKFIIGFAIPILIMLLFIQGLFNPGNKTIIADFGFAQLGLEGIIKTLKIVGTLLVFLGSFYITTKTTETGRMVAAFHRVGLRGKFGYLILATLNVVPQMQKRVAVIREAQNARGLETTGNLKQRFSAFIPLVGPLVMSSLIDVQERGMTLEIRGFSIKNVMQTSFLEAVVSPLDKKIKLILELFFIAILVYAILMRFL
jgi:energy-coupling factor transport system permease protein